MKRALAALCVVIWAGTVAAEEFNARVIAVLDGDTLLVLHDGAKVKVRMANIDAPEKDQAFGMQARQSLADMVLRKQVSINSQAVDQYGRVVGLVSQGGRNINEEQVKRGMAWEYSHFHSDKGYLSLQKNAQQERRGLWSQGAPQAPWQWRKTHPAVKADTSRRTRVPPAAVVSDAACGHKKHCAEMGSCDEAYVYFKRCGESALDKNRDGVPCEALCAAGK